LAYFSSVVFLVPEQGKQVDRFLATGCVLVIGCCIVSVLYMLVPLALVSEVCCSVDTMRTQPSLVQSALWCGELNMDVSGNAEFTKLVSAIKACPIGARLPLVGVVSVADLKSYAKLFATVVPAMITVTVTRVY